MTSDIKAMTDELVRDANSLMFLQLGEVLRTRGQIDAAKKVALTGLERHLQLPEAHDLYARILVSGEELEEASKVWATALELDPRHLGAHKGLGFLYYSQGDLDSALDHLELALSADPTNQSVLQGLKAVRQAADTAVAGGAPPEVASPPAPQSSGDESQALFEGFETGDHGILLVDGQGRALAGGIKGPDGGDWSEEAAAHVAGVSQELKRTSRMLEMGEWESLVVEADAGNVHLTQPAEDALLFIVRDRDVPAGRLGLLAESAGARAKDWLEGQRK